MAWTDMTTGGIAVHAAFSGSRTSSRIPDRAELRGLTERAAGVRPARTAGDRATAGHLPPLLPVVRHLRGNDRESAAAQALARCAHFGGDASARRQRLTFEGPERPFYIGLRSDNPNAAVIRSRANTGGKRTWPF